MTESSSPAYHSTRFFIASCIALIVTAMSFAIRGDIMGDLGTQFSLNKEQLGWVATAAFWGFTLAMVFGGPLCDVMGMGRILILAFIGHIVGILITIFANGFWMLLGGTLLLGLGNGFVEAACNPLIATIYPDKKTEKLNQFHVWFPGGIVIGGLVAFALTNAGLSWQIKMATMILPTLIYAAMFLGKSFPQTERVAAGVSTGDMFKACFSPLFIVMVFCMLLTAATELGPQQWITNIMTNALGGASILVLVWITGLMAVGRQFAGPIVHKISPTGMLLFGAVFSVAGLLGLSFAKGSVMIYAAATVFAVGVCYFWPTMLGFVSERVPQSGALGLAIMGGAGMLSAGYICPVMGKIFDKFKGQGLDELAAGTMTLRYVAVLPAILVVLFLILFIRDKVQGGYKAQSLSSGSSH